MTEVIELQLAGTYRRRVKASLARIWENVFDWEHLAHLHDGSFAECALIERGTWGWRVDLTPVAGTTQRIEMRANRAGGATTSARLWDEDETMLQARAVLDFLDVESSLRY